MFDIVNEDQIDSSDADITEVLHDSTFKYSCSFQGCELQFKRKDQLDSHEFTHSQVKKFKCNIENCDKAYVNNAHLQRHIRNQHNPSNELVQCKYENCSAFFDNETKMQQHCHNVHSGRLAEFECDICSLKFRRKTHLKKHMFEHTGDYLYKCSICDKGFLQLSHLKRHEATHSQRQCDLCDQIFDKWSSLVAHKHKVHPSDGNDCPVCKKIFQSKRALRHHKTTHATLEDRTVFECTFDGCPKFFFQRKNMLAHYRSKHERQVFICPESDCGQELSTKQKLTLHITTIHSKQESKQVQNSSKPRAKRKDKGMQKISTASKLFNIVLPQEFERAIISGNATNIYFSRKTHDDEDSTTCSMLENVNKPQLETVKV